MPNQAKTLKLVQTGTYARPQASLKEYIAGIKILID